MTLTLLGTTFGALANDESTSAQNPTAAPVLAQNPQPAPDTGGSAGQPSSESQLGAIIVTAQRREQRLNDVPISVQAETGQQLVEAGITDSRSLVEIAPGLSFTGGYTPTSTSLSIRGVASLATEGGIQPSVNVVVDGVPLARQAEFVSDLVDIDRIEVLSGPQGTLFGKNSTAGVVNIVSNRPTWSLGGAFEATGTNDEEAIGKFMVNLPVSDALALRFNGYYHYIDPLLKNIGSAGNEMGERAYGGTAKALLKFNDDADLLLTATAGHSYNTFGVNLVVVPNSPPIDALQREVFGPIGYGVTTINQDVPSYNKVDNAAITAELNWNLTDHLKLVSISSFHYFFSRTEIDVSAGPTDYNPGEGFSPNPLGYPITYVATDDRHQPEAWKYYSQEFRLAWDADPFNVIGGLFYQHYRETRQENLPIILDGAFATQNPALAGVPFIDGADYDSKISDNTVALFGDTTYKVTPEINIFAGLRLTTEALGLTFHRLEYFNPVNGLYNPENNSYTAAPLSTLDFATRRTTNNVSGRVGMQWQPTRDFNYYISYNRGYKGPAADQGRAVASAADALLKPEIADAYEVGAKQLYFDQRLAINASLYYQTIKNIQQSAVLPDTTVTDLVNAGSLKTRGFELDIAALPIENFKLTNGLVVNIAYYASEGTPIRFSCGPSETAGVGPCATDDTQSLEGKQAIGTPKIKDVTTASYAVPLPGNLQIVPRLSYDWSSSIQYQLYEDPLTRVPSVGIMNASLGFGTYDDRWVVTAFVNNLTDKFYYDNLNTSDFFIGRSFGNLPRDFKRYYGLRFNLKI